jgi:membrane associated rhomboid family serine protease|tara:strand:+ start:1980 stop:2672 length:693 start_codon:yes stop_codon:yes gene_type:complete
MLPLSDENPTKSMPISTLFLIGSCLLCWLLVQGAGVSSDTFLGSICTFGTIPIEITGNSGVIIGTNLCQIGGYRWQTVFSSMFLHGSWLHLIGNIWFLWIFGNNVEDFMGHVRFCFFFLFAGVVATLAHVFSASTSAIPMVGASGAISGIMGAYLLLYPRARVRTLVLLGFAITVISIPAWAFLGLWALLQLFGSAMNPIEGGGVAYMAHLGGFCAGIAVALLSRKSIFR